MFLSELPHFDAVKTRWTLFPATIGSGEAGKPAAIWASNGPVEKPANNMAGAGKNSHLALIVVAITLVAVPHIRWVFQTIEGGFKSSW